MSADQYEGADAPRVDYNAAQPFPTTSKSVPPADVFGTDVHNDGADQMTKD